nr:GreA/GreB family elongation factor [Geomonas limicola]
MHRLIISRLAADLALFSAAAKAAHEAAIHEENIPDNKYDTLSLEASYLAQGQANRAQEIKSALHAYRNLALQQFSEEDAIRLTALVTLEANDGETRTVFIGPAEGGMKLDLEGSEVLVITPNSPLGRDLIGKSVGETVELGKGRDLKEFEVTEVS